VVATRKQLKINYLQLEMENLLFVAKWVRSGKSGLEVEKVVRSGLAPKTRNSFSVG